jgi:hypothetical protein
MKNKDDLHMIAVGCWGVYCDDGDYIITKYKKGKVEPSEIKRGQRRVARALIEYVSRNDVTDMYLAGDNVYQLGVSATDGQAVAEFLKNKQKLVADLTGNEVDPLQNFNIEVQISEGFEKCFAEAKVDRFFLAIGNHDIENCHILNTEYNYRGWNIPSLYYNVLYNMKDFKINVIVLDTNMFEDKPVTCLNEPFTEDQIDSQVAWALSVAEKGDWNIVIGHIPYLANGHKKDKPLVLRKRLSELIGSMSPQLYICADEHNQQFIQTDKTAIVIAGSGGTALDKILDHSIQGTLYQRSDFSFVSYRIGKNELVISFISPENKVTFSHVLKR